MNDACLINSLFWVWFTVKRCVKHWPLNPRNRIGLSRQINYFATPSRNITAGGFVPLNQIPQTRNILYYIIVGITACYV